MSARQVVLLAKFKNTSRSYIPNVIANQARFDHWNSFQRSLTPWKEDVIEHLNTAITAVTLLPKKETLSLKILLRESVKRHTEQSKLLFLVINAHTKKTLKKAAETASFPIPRLVNRESLFEAVRKLLAQVKKSTSRLKHVTLFSRVTTFILARHHALSILKNGNKAISRESRGIGKALQIAAVALSWEIDIKQNDAFVCFAHCMSTFIRASNPSTEPKVTKLLDSFFTKPHGVFWTTWAALMNANGHKGQRALSVSLGLLWEKAKKEKEDIFMRSALASMLVLHRDFKHSGSV